MKSRRPDHCPECGCEIKQTKSVVRSVPQLKRYFAVLRAAFDAWPETHEHQFSNVEEFRAWLQMKSGYREIGAKIPLAGMSKERACLLAEAAIRATGSYAVPVIHGNTLVVFRPKSIAFQKLSHYDACKLFEQVEAFVEDAIGVSCDELLKNAEAA